MAFIINPEGDIAQIKVGQDGIFPLTTLHCLIGGAIEGVQIGDASLLLYNQDADLLRQPVNVIGTMMAQALYRKTCVVAGIVMIAYIEEIETATHSTILIHGRK